METCPTVGWSEIFRAAEATWHQILMFVTLHAS